MAKLVSDIIVEVLKSAGVKRCYGIVGDTLNTVAKSIHDGGIEWVHMRHEEAGGFAAQAEAQLTGCLTAVAGTCGPGSLHFINSLFEAARNRAPVILIATQVTREEIGFDFIQEVDLEAIYRSFAVFSETILTADQARRKTVLACQTAIAKSGVAVLVVPVDIAQAKSKDDTPFAVHISRPEIRPNADDLDRIADILNAGEKITIYAGDGCRNGRTEVLAAAEKLKAPIAHTTRSKDIFEWDNPYDVGFTGILGNPVGLSAVSDCDTLLLLGCDFAWRQFYPSKAKIVQIDCDATRLGRRHPVTLGVVGNIRETVAALLPRLKLREAGAHLDELASHYAEYVKETASKAMTGHKTGVSPIHLTALIDRHAAADALFSGDDGTALVWMVRHIKAGGGRRMFGSLLHGTMAGGLGGAIGLQKAEPSRQVVVLAGDGGLAMLMGELLTVIQEKLPIKIVVYDNGKLGFVDMEQKTEGMVPLYTDLVNPDFGKVAATIGLWGRTVTSMDGMEDAVQAWLAEPGPALLNVKVDPMTLVIPPKTEFAQAYGMALYSARAVLGGEGKDLWEMVKENFL